MLEDLSRKELLEINGGGAWGNWIKTVEDAGQYCGGFLVGLFTGSCPEQC